MSLFLSAAARAGRVNSAKAVSPEVGLVIGVIAVIVATAVIMNATTITTRLLRLEKEDPSRRVIRNVLYVVGVGMLIWGGYAVILTTRDLI